jgi:hypothetical protein
MRLESKKKMTKQVAVTLLLNENTRYEEGNFALHPEAFFSPSLSLVAKYQV